jgi:hypothetical protein
VTGLECGRDPRPATVLTLPKGCINGMHQRRRDELRKRRPNIDLAGILGPAIRGPALLSPPPLHLGQLAFSDPSTAATRYPSL